MDAMKVLTEIQDEKPEARKIPFITTVGAFIKERAVPDADFVYHFGKTKVEGNSLILFCSDPNSIRNADLSFSGEEFKMPEIPYNVFKYTPGKPIEKDTLTISADIITQAPEDCIWVHEKENTYKLIKLDFKY
jgi:hypothetical protein